MNTNKSDYDKCRLCLVDGDKDDFTPIFSNNDDPGVSLAVRIMVCLSLPIQARDSFPGNVCKTCEHRVTHFYAFREICYNSYYSLLQAATPYDAKEKFVNVDQEDNKNSASVRIEAENAEPNCPISSSRAEVSDPSSEQNNQTTRNEEEEEEEEAPVETLQSARIAEEIPTNIVTDVRLENFQYKPIDRTDVKSCEDERDTEEINFVNDEVRDIVKYKCLACDDIFPDLDSASIHCAECSQAIQVDDPSVERSESVEYLDESYSENRQSNEEIGNDTSKNPRSTKFPCDRRNERDKASSTLRKRKIRDNNCAHSCNDCESKFASAALLRRHTVVHTGERPFECSICKKRFSQVGQLNFHKNFHVNPRYRCDVCKKPFLRPSDIEKHMRTHTGEKPYVCDVCDKSFAQLVALQQHQRIHTGDKPYDCEICGKRFSQKANKTKHVKIHKEGAKPHTCEICGRSFSDVEEMTLHRAGHGGGKPRKCNYCDDSFRKMSELSQHVRRYHTFERPHKCAFCQKAFYSLYNLKQHVMVHTGQKPYACSRCDLKFTQKGNLTKHFDRKHAEKYSSVTDNEEVNGEEICNANDNATTDANCLYACSRCDGKFARREHLHAHLRRRHADEKTDDTIKYMIIEREDIDGGKDTDGVFILEDDLSESTSNPLTIEREETVEVATRDENTGHNNLQIYEIAE